MLNLLLNPSFIIGALTVIAFITPVLAFIVSRRFSERRMLRLIGLMGASGPALLLLWGIHEALIRTVGFDNVLTVVIMLGITGVAGWFAGEWAFKD